MNEDMTVVWNGSHKDVYLCIPEFQARDFSHMAPAVILKGRPKVDQPRADHRDRVLALLAQRDMWPTAALRGWVHMSNGDYYRQLTQLAAEGVIEWKHGWVALTRKDAA
jgi:hypothetical protein